MATVAGAVSETADRAYRKIINAWCLYDWANSAFATTIMAALLPCFYDNVAGGDFGKWGLTNSVSMLLVAISAPVLGAIGDHTGARKHFLAGFASLGILSTAFMVFLGSGDWVFASLLYIGGRVGFAGGNIFYDSLLPHVARPHDIDQVSARGYAMGYLGGGLLLAVNLFMILPQCLGFETGACWSFLTVAFWWVLFSIPLLRRVPEPGAAVRPGESANPIRAGFQRLGKTFREIRRYRQLTRFLVALWCYCDGIGTIYMMAAIFATDALKKAGAGHAEQTVFIVGAILTVQFVGVPFAIAFGRLARGIGAKRSILLGIAIYTCICIGGRFMSQMWHFWVLAIAVATVQGGTQALTRSLYGRMSPKTKVSEFFGFYNVSAKFAGIVGPAVCYLIYKVTGSSQQSILAIAVFFILGALILMTVNVEEGMRVAREEDDALRLEKRSVGAGDTKEA